MENGAQGRNRTTDTVIFSHVLYQLSYLGVGSGASIMSGYAAEIEKWAGPIKASGLQVD